MSLSVGGGTGTVSGVPITNPNPSRDELVNNAEAVNKAGGDNVNQQMTAAEEAAKKAYESGSIPNPTTAG